MDDPSTPGVTEGFGLMFYNARWMDPYLNHFTQPDSIVPDPYNPQDWNRYSYARNNPVRYTDPTGHAVYEGDDGGLTVAGYTYVVEKKYNWKLKGKFSLEEVKAIYQTGNDILAYADEMTGDNGLDWMHYAFGNTIIEHGYRDDGRSITMPSFLGAKIALDRNWLTHWWGAEVLFAHELGHVWDINSGFTASGAMNKSLGGSSWCFFCAPGSGVPQWDPFYHPDNGDAYGNSSRNEYFAEALSAAVYNPDNVPTGALEWMRLQMIKDVLKYLFPGGLQ
jgi:RHS repeat-associated protein